MTRLSPWLFGATLLIVACRPKAPPHYIPTADEAAWEKSHDAEEAADFNAALDGYQALCNSATPYVRACFDHARLLFETRAIEEARRATIALVNRYPDDGLSQSAVKRLAKSFARRNEYLLGISTLEAMGAALEETDIFDTILYETAKLAAQSGDTDLERRKLEQLVSTHGRWESQLWDDAVWRLARIAAQSADTRQEKAWIRILLDAEESSWLIGSYTSPFHDDALLRLGHLFLAESKPEEAAAVFDSAAATQSSRLVDEALLGAAEARIAMGKFREACTILTKILERKATQKHVARAKTLGSAAKCRMH